MCTKVQKLNIVRTGTGLDLDTALRSAGRRAGAASSGPPSLGLPWP